MSCFIEYFECIEDPKVDRTKKYPLMCIIAITVIETLCGADGWDGIVVLAEARADWFFEVL